MKTDLMKLTALHAAVKVRHKYQDQLEAQEAAHCKYIRELKKEISENAAVAKSKKKSRTNERTEVYRAAIKDAQSPDDAHSVLRSMQVIAHERRFPHLLGYVPDEGFQWAVLTDEPPKMQHDRSALDAIRREIKKTSR